MGRCVFVNSVLAFVLSLALMACASSTSNMNPPGYGKQDLGNASDTAFDAERDGLFPVLMQPQPVVDFGGGKQSARGVSWVRPSELLALLPPAKLLHWTDSNLSKAATDFDPALPHNQVSDVMAPSLIFSPLCDSENAVDIEDVAYCTYRFSLSDFATSGKPQTIGLYWHTNAAPQLPGGDDDLPLWIGFANLGLDRWDWYAGPLDSVLTIDSFASYTAANGDVLLMVAVLGTAECALEGLRIGDAELRALGGIEGELGEDAVPPPAGGSGLPESVDLSPDCSPVGDQGQIGSCTCFASARGALDYEMHKVYQADGWDFADTFNLSSTKYLYLMTGLEQGYGCGAYDGRITKGVVEYLLHAGDATELNAPYVDICNQNWGQAAEDDAALLNADGVKSINPKSSEGVLKLKYALAAQRNVVIIQTGIDSDFLSLQPGQVWNYTGKELIGYHAMSLVGYDNAKQAFKVRNSWGTGWCELGYGWISYATFKTGNPDLSLWAWTLQVDYDQAVAQRFCGQQQELAPPGNLQASDGTYSLSIKLSWEKSVGATGYKVYRDTPENLVKTLDDINSWDDTEITDYLGHTYWVQSIKPGIDSELSAPDVGYLAQAPVIQDVQPRTGEPGQILTFTALVQGSSPLSYEWNFGGGATPNSSTNSAPQVTLGATGVYSAALSVTNDYGSNTYDFNLTVSMNELPVAYLLADPVSGSVPLSVDFDASASYDSDGALAKFEWDWTDDGLYDFDSGSDATVTHTYTSQGLYTCRVRVTDDEGGTNTSTASLAVDLNTYTASGYVKTPASVGIAGVTVNFTGGLASVTTDSNGYWTRNIIPDGLYTATPEKSGYSFAPTSREFTISGADATVNDFTGTQNVYTVSGYVKDSSETAIPGVLISFTGGIESVTTDIVGFWERTSVPNGTYTVTPSKSGLYFSPSSRSVTVADAHVSSVDFVGVDSLDPPENISASDGTSASDVHVTWTKSANAMKYEIYRSTTSTGTYSLVSGELGDIASWDDTSASAATQYYYKVKAGNNDSWSAFSNYDSGWRNLSVPSSIVASKGSGSYPHQVHLSWNSVNGATSYKVYESNTEYEIGSYITTKSSSPYTHDTYEDGVAYYYTIIPSCSFGDADEDDCLNMQQRGWSLPPKEPTNVHGYDYDASYMRVTYTRVWPYDNVIWRLYYYVGANPPSGTSSSWIDTGGNNSSGMFIIPKTGYPTGQNIWFGVQAKGDSNGYPWNDWDRNSEIVASDTAVVL